MSAMNAPALSIAQLGEQARGYVAQAVAANTRRGYASRALDRDALIHPVGTTLGHADLRTTSAYTYARPGDSSTRYLAV